MIGVYLHIPFCARRCDYCDFFVVVDERPDRGFFDWLRRDLEAAAARAARRLGVDTIYLGGGTPSFTPPERIQGLIGACRDLFDVQGSCEVTLEANPEDVTADRLDAWRRAGITRLSLGVQSLADEVLAPRGRLYRGVEAEEAVRLSRAAGFGSLGVDLIAGLPGESVEGFLDGLRRLAGLGPDHVSIYLLETEQAGKDTALARAAREGRARPASDDDAAAMYLGAVDALAATGYRHYEISNFARPGHESRHNLKYWRCEEYLGAGPSAHSLMGGRRFARPSELGRWETWVDSGGPIDEGDYTLREAGARAREALVLGLRLVEGVDLDRFAATWSFDPRAEIAQGLREAVEAGLVRLQGPRLALTRRGLLLANEVFVRLV